MSFLRKKEVPLVTLETPRLRIVPLTWEEFTQKLYDKSVDAELHDAMEELYARAEKDSRRRFAYYTNRMLVRKEDGLTIGSIAFMNAPQKDPDHLGLVEVGYSVDEPFRGQGYMTEALSAMCEWALARDEVYGMIAGVMDGNTASMRVLEKCGFLLTDHSDALHLQVYKKIPPAKKPISFWKRFL